MVEAIKENRSVDLEHELIKLAQNGDTDAFDKLMLEHQQTIFRLAYRMLDNRDDALDVVQETFYNAWRSLKKFRGESSLRLWLETIATRLCISRYRKKRIFIDVEKLFGLGFHPQWDDEIDANKHRKAIAQAMKTLSPKERAAFILRMKEKYSTRDTAEIMKIAEGTVKALLHRANEKMKKSIARILPDEFLNKG